MRAIGGGIPPSRRSISPAIPSLARKLAPFFKKRPEGRPALPLPNIIRRMSDSPDSNDFDPSRLRLSPQDIAIIRKQMANMVQDYLADVRAVLSGHRAWTNNQIKLFTLLTNKVVPDLHHSYTQIGIEGKSVSELTREQLEEIALNGALGRTIDATDEHLTPNELSLLAAPANRLDIHTARIVADETTNSYHTADRLRKFRETDVIRQRALSAKTKRPSRSKAKQKP